MAVNSPSTLIRTVYVSASATGTAMGHTTTGSIQETKGGGAPSTVSGLGVTFASTGTGTVTVTFAAGNLGTLVGFSGTHNAAAGTLMKQWQCPLAAYTTGASTSTVALELYNATVLANPAASDISTFEFIFITS